MLLDTEVPFQIERLGTIMEGDAGNPDESWGVLNPAIARTKQGEAILFPRVVADNNLSRVGLARVLYDAEGDPYDVERLGYALEPTESYERNPRTAGCEDPRVTYVQELDKYVMTYTAYGPLGPRIGMAVSDDLFSWKRLGLVKFDTSHGVEWDFYDNKDAVIFPRLVMTPDGKPAVAMMHRPTYDLSVHGAPVYNVLPNGVEERRPSMWISYCSVERLGSKLEGLNHFCQHQLLATPKEPWEILKIGGGTPPVLTEHGWLSIYHGVSGQILDGVALQPNVHYSAGAMVLDRDDVSKVLYRSNTPILAPQTDGEREGLVANVVFPTAIDERGNGRIDIYYGMADSRIGVGKLTIPAALPGYESSPAKRVEELMVA